ncbi:hypothetical protein [Burkholderia sp. TSV86]|nr:hypothetical protein [Burkholderia sp. TSV86]
MPLARRRPRGIHASREAKRTQLRRMRDGTSPAPNGNDESMTGNKRR